MRTYTFWKDICLRRNVRLMWFQYECSHRPMPTLHSDISRSWFARLLVWCVCFRVWSRVWFSSFLGWRALLLFERSDKVVVFLPKKLHPSQLKVPENVCVCKWRRVREWFMHYAEGGDGDRMSRSSGLRPLWDQSHRKAEAGCPEFTWVLLFFFFQCWYILSLDLWLMWKNDSLFFFLTLDFSEVYSLKTQYRSCSGYVCVNPLEPCRSSWMHCVWAHSW